MSRKIKIIGFVVLITAVVLFLNDRIDSRDMRFYSGKDGGFVVRIESNILMSALFFCILTRKNRIIYFAIGLLLGILSSVIAILVAAFTSSLIQNDIFDIGFHVLGSLLFMLSFFLVERISAWEGRPSSS